MKTYRRLIESNDNEGETWSWWLQADGNETALKRLQDACLQFGDDMFELTEDLVHEAEVDILVRYTDGGYYSAHNKVDGALFLPKFGDYAAFWDQMYKGGIQSLFLEPDRSRVVVSPKPEPARFRKKPVEVSAMQYTDDTAFAVYDWIVASNKPVKHDDADSGPGVTVDPADGRIVIRTLEGDMKASLGDWVIRGVAGEFYACREDIFNATYEPVEVEG